MPLAPTAKQDATLASLARQLGVGTYAADAVKHWAGKRPIQKVDRRKASRIIGDLIVEVANNRRR